MKDLNAPLCGLGCLAGLLGSSCTPGTADSQSPNILLIVVDDMGFSDTQPFGGEIRTPTLSRLADKGIRFSRFHTSSLSAPTRAMLLTGVDNHQNGFGIMPSFHGENQYLQPGYEGYLNDRVMTLAEVLGASDYYTCMSGKWHLGSQPGHTPDARGFARSFTMLGGGASHGSNFFALSQGEAPITFYMEDGVRIDTLPDGFYSSEYYTDKMLEYVAECPAGKPFFAYLAYTAPHDPLQVPDEWLDRYEGVYDCGYDTIRMRRFERLQSLGFVPGDRQCPALTGDNPAWSDLSPDERREQVRRMEIYAAMIECVDEQIGRLLDSLDRSGRLDNTLVIFMSDNGANPKEAYNYPESSKEYVATHFDNRYENYGKPTSFVSQGAAWAEVSNTPYARYKKTTNEGGICTPLIVYGPKFVEQSRLDTTTLLHVTDVFPTILDVAGVDYPALRSGKSLAALCGRSFLPVLQGEERAECRTLCFEMCEDKAVIRGGWKAVLLAPPYGDGNTWKLYDLTSDLSEQHDLSEVYPAVLQDLIEAWEDYAGEVGYIKNCKQRTSLRLGCKEFYRYDRKNQLPQYRNKEE